MRKLLIFVLTVCIASFQCECFADEPISVVCTSFPCYDFARAIVGDTTQITLLIKPGAEVHTYEPSPTDILTISSCDLFIYIGGESDVWVESILESFGNDAPPTLRFFDCVEALEEETTSEMTVHASAEEEEEETEYDEHIWTSPKNAVRMVQALAEALHEIPVLDDAKIDQSAAAYISEIEALDAEFAQAIDAGKHRTIVFGDRFPLLYFARAYDLDYAAAFPSCTSESEPSAHTVAALIDRIRAEKIPVVFALELSSGRIAETIAEETGAKKRTFYSVQNISIEDFKNGETYVSLMRRNLNAIREAVG